MEGLTMFPFGLYAEYILYKNYVSNAKHWRRQKHIGNKPSATNPPAWPSVLNAPTATLRVHSHSTFKTKLACTIWFRE